MAPKTIADLTRILVSVSLALLVLTIYWRLIGAPMRERKEAQRETQQQELRKRYQYDVSLHSRYGAGKPRAWVKLLPFEETPVISIEERSDEWRGWMDLSGCVEVTVNERHVFEQCGFDENTGLQGNTSLWGDMPKQTIRFKAKSEPVSILLFVDRLSLYLNPFAHGDLTLKEDTPTGRFYVRPGTPVSVVVDHREISWSGSGTSTLQQFTWTVAGGCVHVHSETRSIRSCPGEVQQFTKLVEHARDFAGIVVHAYEEEAIMEVEAIFGEPRRFNRTEHGR